MMPGGDLYKRFAAKFDPVAGDSGQSAAAASTTAALSSGGTGVDFNQILDLAGLGGSTTAASQALDPVAAGLLAPLGLTSGQALARKAGSDDFMQELAAVIGVSQDSEGKPDVPDYGASGATGLKEYLTGDKDHVGFDVGHSGDNYHDHVAFATPEQARAAARLLNENGIQTTELKGVNKVGGHSPSSYHYSGQAFDVPAAQVPVGQERALSRRVRQLLSIA
jgi:hypothetical protein